MKRLTTFSVSALLLLTMGVMMTSCHSKKELALTPKQYMEAVYTTLKDSLDDAQITIVQDSIKILFPENLLFETNKSSLKESAVLLMGRFARILNDFNKTNLLINGYTDNTGNDAYNLKLSKERAESAQSALINDQIDASRTYIWGRGSANPIGDNTTIEGRRLNRRVEFIVLYHVAGH